MRRSTIAFFLLAFGCSSAPAPVDVSCESTQTCSESVCPDLCGDGAEIIDANCFSSSCYCRCKYEGQPLRPGCFSGGRQPWPHSTEVIRTEIDCAETRNCESACEAECVWGFRPSMTECEHSGPSNELDWRCNCWCPRCQFTG